MSFLLDRKREHETAATSAVKSKNFSLALFHAAQAADLGFQLAEQASGLIAARYAEDAHGWVEIAKQLKAKATTAQPASKTVPSAGAQEGDESARQKSWKLEGKPTDRLADVAGLSDVKTQLREMVIEPFNHPQVYERFNTRVGGGVLMYGPPGNGKTYIARAVAGELDAAFFLVDAAQIKDKYVGETEKKLTSLFEEARAEPRAVIFLDEVDELLGQRGNQKIGTVTTFLRLADGFVKKDGCLLLLAATNKPWMLSPAVIRPGRLGTHVYVGLPDEAARLSILQYCFKGVPTEGIDWAEAARRIEGYSGAETAEVADRAKKSAIRRQLQTARDEAITPADLEAGIAAVPPQTDAEQLKDFDRWRYGRERGSRSDSADAGED